MNKKLVEAVLIIDRSGSMSSIKTETINGINEFIESQKNLGLECRITIAQFDNEYDLLADYQDVQTVEPINESIYIPRGMTALNDAIGKTITSLQARLKTTKKKDRPSKTVIAIITDGQENASTEYTGPKIKALIEELETKEKWTFLYIAANQDAIKEAHTRGISANNTLNFASTGAQGTMGSQGAFRAMNSYVNTLYTSGSASFSAEDRAAAMGQSSSTGVGVATEDTSSVA